MRFELMCGEHNVMILVTYHSLVLYNEVNTNLKKKLL
jgi:hypothetical protein